MAFYSYLSTKIIIMTFITKSYQNLFGVRSYINANKKVGLSVYDMRINLCAFQTAVSQKSSDILHAHAVL